MATQMPISDDELEPLFSGLDRYRLLILAVSGGSDSTALMHLIARWRQRRGAAKAPEIRVATVDHDLRANARAEAEAVAASAAALGLPHHLLTWLGAKPSSGLQEAARKARYDLLAAMLRGLGEASAALVTAHTADDQAETLLMRLARGSGIDGLSAMSRSRPLMQGEPVHLVRPLLSVPKSRLIATLQAAGIPWSEDPSNARSQFERVRIRAAASQLADLSLTADKLALSAQRLQRTRTAVEWASLEFEKRVLDLHGGAFAAIPREDFAAAPADLRLRLLARVLTRFGGASPPARFAKIEALLDRLSAGRPLTATLGGCTVSATASELRIFREPGRHGLPECAVMQSTPMLWDNRFAVSVAGGNEAEDAPIVVRALGQGAYATLRKDLGNPMPSRAAATLPAFWTGSTLLAVPLLGPRAGVADRSSPFSFRTEFLGLPDEERISDEGLGQTSS